MRRGAQLVKGWLEAHPAWAALLAGAVLPLSFAPFFILPVFYLSYAVFFTMLQRAASDKAAFRCGWLFGFGQFFTGFIWMGEAFFVDAEKFLWLLPFAITLLPAGLALFVAVAGLAAYRGTKRFALGPVSAALLLALCLAGLAYLRSTILTGLPWNLPVMGWASWLYLAQPVAYLGVHGLGLVALISALLLAVADPKARLVGLALPVLACLVSLLHLHGLATPPLLDTRVILVQPNIPQIEKWAPQHRAENIERTFRLTGLALSQTPDADLIIWPETALPALLDEGTGFGERLRALYPAETRAPYLLAGSIRRDQGAAGTDYFNSAMLFSGDGALLARSDKHHLVPFGEYLPLQKWLEAIGFRQLTQLRGGYTPGPPHARLSAARLPQMAVLICYEAIFPYLSAADPRPAVLVNITNDAWFGRSIGPHQHLAIARLRAIEQGLPFLRSANTGISVGYDARGRRLDSLALGEAGSLSLRLPGALPPTLYARFGDTVFGVLYGLVIVALLLQHRRKRLHHRQG